MSHRVTQKQMHSIPGCKTQGSPEFYNRDQRGIPTQWVGRMRNSMATLTPQFSANRTVRQYTEQYYLPAATTYLARRAAAGAAGISIVRLRQTLTNAWQDITFGDVRVNPVANGYLFHVPIRLHQLSPDQILVELYADGIDGAGATRIALETKSMLHDVGNYVYEAVVSTNRPASDFTARIMPNYENISVPLEDGRIHWQR